MKKFLAILLASIMVMSLVACGGASGDKYVAKSVSFYGYETEWSNDEMGECYIILGSDGKVSLTMNGETGNGTYTNNGENYAITIDGDTVPATLSGTKFTLCFTEEDPDLGEMSYEIIFEKA